MTSRSEVIDQDARDAARFIKKNYIPQDWIGNRAYIVPQDGLDDKMREALAQLSTYTFDGNNEAIIVLPAWRVDALANNITPSK